MRSHSSPNTLQLGGYKAYYLRVGEGENPHDAIREAAERNGLVFALVHGIGGFGEARLAVYNPEKKTYRYVVVKPLENHVMEVISLSGNLVRGEDGGIYTHLHAIVARTPGEVYGGHLVSARVKPFLELFIIAFEAERSSLAPLFEHRWTTRFSYEELRE